MLGGPAHGETIEFNGEDVYVPIMKPLTVEPPMEMDAVMYTVRALGGASPGERLYFLAPKSMTTMDALRTVLSPDD